MEIDGLKKTALYDKHLKLKAQMVPFAGWNMPLQYDKITNEHLNVRENAGLFDISHMGKFIIKGKKALDLLQGLVPQDLNKLIEGKAVYTQFCNRFGGIIDDLIIYRLKDDNDTYRLLVIVNAINTKKDYNWIVANQNDTSNIIIEDITDTHSFIALQGPKATNIIETIGIREEEQPKRFHIIEKKVNNETLIIARTGYTGEDGFEILSNNSFIGILWDTLIEKGKSFNLKPIGIAARDTLRLEAAYPLHGNDIDESSTPIEANLAWSVAKDKENFIGKEALCNQLANGTNKVFIGFKMLSNSIPRKGCEIFQDGHIIGSTTSGSIAPYLNYAIGLGYIDQKSKHTPNSKIDILIRNKKIPAEIVQIPFYKRKKR